MQKSLGNFMNGIFDSMNRILGAIERDVLLQI